MYSIDYYLDNDLICTLTLKKIDKNKEIITSRIDIELNIESTIYTSYSLIAPNCINNYIQFANYSDKKVTIEIKLTFNNFTKISEIIEVEANNTFKKTYWNNISIATFKIKVLSLA